MYAVIAAGGKQYRVQEGQTVRLERLDVEKGQTVEFTPVLLVRGEGQPVTDKKALANAKVVGEIVQQARNRKVVVFKFKRRKDYKRTHGHRQAYTGVHITKIEG